MDAEVLADRINVTFSMEKNTKYQFDRLCDEIGLSAPAVLNALVRQAIREQGMHFSILDENGFTPEEAEEIKGRIAEMKAGKMERHSEVTDTEVNIVKCGGHYEDK